MTTEHKDRAGIERLAEVLETYGAAPERWPGTERDALLRLARDTERGRELLTAARRLDEVMAHAPAGEPGQALVSRIVAAAVADGAREARVVPLNAAAGREVPDPRPSRAVNRAWAPALLAASLLLGLYLGTAELAPSLFTQSLQIAGLEGAGEDVEDIFGAPIELAVDRETML